MVEIRRQLIDATPMLLLEDHTLPLVRFMVALRSGGCHDAQSGTTRTLMEMLLRGTAHRDRRQFNGELEELGSPVHAMTGQDTALLRGTCLTRHLETTIALVAEALAEPALAEAELEPFLAEAIEGLRSERDDDDSVAELFLRRALYQEHPLGRSPQGEIVDLQSMTPERVRTAHQQLIAGDQLLLFFAGDINEERAAECSRILLRDLPKSGESRRIEATIRRPTTREIWVIDKPERSQAQLRLASPATDGNSPDAVGFWLGTTAFGGTFTAPFCREVRDVRGWSYTAHAAFDRRSRYAAPVVMRSAPAATDLRDCLALELELYANLAKGELAASDVDLARTYLANREPLERTSTAQLLPLLLKNELLGRTPEELFSDIAALEGLPIAEVGRIMRRNLRPDGVVALMVATAAEMTEELGRRFPEAKVEVRDYREGLALE